MIRAGELRHRIKILSRNSSVDSFGQPLGLVLTDEVWAKISPASEKTQRIASAQQQQISHEIVMRYLSSFSSSNFVEYAGRKFKVMSVLNFDERNRMMLVTAMEGSYD